MPTLNELKEGDLARIVDIDGDDSIAVRLMEMGLTAGEEIELIGFAPLGDPILFELRGSSICLRRSEAREILVRALPPPRT